MTLTNTSPTSADIEYIFLGTGTSTATPYITCLTSADKVEDIACRCCREAIDGTDRGWKNERGNVGGLIRKRGEDGRIRNILIDAGKTFRAQAIKYFRKHGIKRIDAVILTHGHSDAINGMDDLRPFTMPPSSQIGSPIPIYLTQQTLTTVSEQFPYMVDTKKATGGGDVPMLEFRVMEAGMEVDIEGVGVLPLDVHHGRYFTPPTDSTMKNIIRPFLCTGFLFDGVIAYFSDINHMPGHSWDLMISAIRKATTTTRTTRTRTTAIGSTSSNGSTNSNVEERRLSPDLWSITDDPISRPTLLPSQLPYLILDCLYLREHASHLSFLQSLKTAMDIDATRTLLIGFTHPVSHKEWLDGCLDIDRMMRSTRSTREIKEEGFRKKMEEWAGVQGMEDELDEVRKWGGVVRPAWDGMKIGVLEGEVVEYGGEDDEEW